MKRKERKVAHCKHRIEARRCPECGPSFDAVPPLPSWMLNSSGGMPVALTGDSNHVR